MNKRTAAANTYTDDPGSWTLTDEAPEYENRGWRLVRPEFLREIASYGGPPSILHNGTNIQLGIVTLLQGERLGYEIHKHNTQLIYAWKGAGLALVNGMGLRLVNGMCVAIPHGCLHDVANIHAEPLHLISVYSDKEHPSLGVYDEKLAIDERPAVIREAPFNTEHAIAAFAALMSHQNPTCTTRLVLQCDKIRVTANKATALCNVVLSREGYYLVTGGHGRVSIDLCGSHDAPTQIKFGSLFYVPHDGWANVHATGTTSVHLLGFCVGQPLPERRLRLIMVQSIGVERTTVLLEKKVVEVHEEPMLIEDVVPGTLQEDVQEYVDRLALDEQEYAARPPMPAPRGYDLPPPPLPPRDYPGLSEQEAVDVPPVQDLNDALLRAVEERRLLAEALGERRAQIERDDADDYDWD